MNLVDALEMFFEAASEEAGCAQDSELTSSPAALSRPETATDLTM